MRNSFNNRRQYTLNQSQTQLMDNIEDRVDISIKTNSLQLTHDNLYLIELDKLKSKIKQLKYTINILELEKSQIKNRTEYQQQSMNKYDEKNKELIQKISNLEVENKYLKFQIHKASQQNHQLQNKIDQITVAKNQSQNSANANFKQFHQSIQLIKQLLLLLESTNQYLIINIIKKICQINRQLQLSLNIQNSLESFLINFNNQQTYLKQITIKLENLQFQNRNIGNSNNHINFNQSIRKYQNYKQYHPEQSFEDFLCRLSKINQSQNSMIINKEPVKKVSQMIHSHMKSKNDRDIFKQFEKVNLKNEAKTVTKQRERQYVQGRNTVTRKRFPSSKQRIKEEIDNIDYQISQLQTKLIQEIKQY